MQSMNGGRQTRCRRTTPFALNVGNRLGRCIKAHQNKMPLVLSSGEIEMYANAYPDSGSQGAKSIFRAHVARWVPCGKVIPGLVW